MMQMTTSTARAMRYAARLCDRAAKGKDLGDTIGVSQIYSGEHAGTTRVEVHIFSPDGTDQTERAEAIRKEIGGIFGENDPHGSPFDQMYQRMERPEEDFFVAVSILRSATHRIEVEHDESSLTSPTSTRRSTKSKAVTK